MGCRDILVFFDRTGRWLLLGDAVQGTTLFDDIQAGDRHDFSVRKEFAQDTTAFHVAAFLIEGGHENGGI